MIRKITSSLLCAACAACLLFSSTSVASSWNREYGSEYHEGSTTAVTDETEFLREKDDPNDDTSLLYTVRPDGSAMIVDYAGKFMVNAKFYFDIPSEINGHPVTAIGDRALRDGYANILGITIPSSVKEIGVNAIDCRYLEYLNLGDGLTVIKDAAINCGDNLTRLVIPESVKYIGNEAITGESLREIVLPKNLEHMGKNILFGSAYENDPQNRIDNILYHGEYLLAGIKIGYVYEDSSDPSAPTINRQVREWEATGDISIREGTTLMCEEAFGMSSITSVKLPSTLKSIPYLGFYWCKNLNNVTIPGNVREIGECAFSWCESLSSLVLSEGVEKIGPAAFFRCNKLNEVTIPQSVTEIGLHAFGWDYVDDYDVRNENLLIRAYSGSAGEKYARENGFRCILLDTGEEIPAGEPSAAADGRFTCEEKGESCAVRRFRDIMSADGDPYHNGIEYCLDKGIMTGTGADTFSPENSITRGQFATMFYRLAGSPAAGASSGFTDLTQDWYKDAVNWAAQNGILNGTSETTFSPDAVITREQIAAIFYRYAQSKGVDMTDDYGDGIFSYRDADEIADYARTPMKWCFDQNVMFLYSPDGYEYLLGPKAAPTRAQTASMFRQLSFVLN